MSKIGNLSTYLVLNVLQRGVAFLLLPLYTASLAPEEFGVMSLAASLSIATAVAYICVPDAIYFAVVRKADDQDAWTASGLRLMLGVLSGTVFAFAVMAWAGVDFDIVGLRANPYLFLAILITLLNGLWDTRLQVLQAQQKAVEFSRLSLVRIGLSTAVTVGILLTAPSALALLIGQAMVGLAQAVFIHRWLLGAILSREGGHASDCVRFGLPLVPHSLAHWGRSSVDRLLLGQYAGTGAVGVLGIGLAVASVLQLVIEAYRHFHNPLQFAWLRAPSVSSASLRAYPMISIASMGILAVAAVAVARPAFDIGISNPEYHQALVYIPTLLAGAVAYGVYVNVVNWVFERDGPATVAKRTVLALSATFPATWILVVRFGIAGAAAGSFLASYVMAALVLMQARRQHDFPVPILGALLMPVLPILATPMTGTVPNLRILAALGVVYGGVIGNEVRLWRRRTAR